MTMDPLNIENTGSLVAQDKQERAQGLGRGPCVTSIRQSPAMAGGENSTSSSVMVTAMPRPRSGSLPASGHRDSREVESILSSPASTIKGRTSNDVSISSDNASIIEGLTNVNIQKKE